MNLFNTFFFIQQQNLIQQNLMQQSLQSLAGQTGVNVNMTLPQVAAAAALQQQFQEQQNQNHNQHNQLHNNQHQNQHSNLTKAHQNLNIQSSHGHSEIHSKSNSNNNNNNNNSNPSLNNTKAAITTPSHQLGKPRTEPSPEEMTDLEELEQFAKTFKQRRIKLGQSFDQVFFALL